MKDEDAKALAGYLRTLADKIEAGRIDQMEVTTNTPVARYYHDADAHEQITHSGEQTITLSFVDKDVKEKADREIAEYLARRDAELGISRHRAE